MNTTTQEAFSAESIALLEFAKDAKTPNGFGWLDSEGRVVESEGTLLWITGRMTHAFSLGALLGIEGCKELAAHGVKTLLNGPLRDDSGKGWHSRLHADGSPVIAAKVAYDHTFVVLAASSAMAANIEDSGRLLSEALTESFDLWWDAEAGMFVDARTHPNFDVDPYRGMNANMHYVEALLAALSSTNDITHLGKALRVCQRVVKEIQESNYRLPEHFDPQWNAIHSYNQDIPADAFRPFGSTIGHWLEWARLLLEVRAECRVRGLDYFGALDVVPQVLYRRSMLEGWGVDGRPGFIYTVDFEGVPVVTQRMHWVLCEALCTAATLHGTTGDASYLDDVEYFWAYAKQYLIESPGRWNQELDAHNKPAHGTWAGRPDVYHALQAMLATSVPVSPNFAWSLRGAQA